jgi:hypothetical protein
MEELVAVAVAVKEVITRLLVLLTLVVVAVVVVNVLSIFTMEQQAVQAL